MSRFLVSAERVIAAPRSEIFELLAHPARHPDFDGSGTVRGELFTSAERLSLGDRFGMQMRMGINYRMKNIVVEFEEGHRIAWKPAGNYVWRYLLEDVSGGTRVTEQWDARKFKMRYLMLALRIPARNHRSIVATLERIAQLTEPG